MAPPSEAGTVPLLISAGLFLTTALASQYLQHHFLKQRESKRNKNRNTSENIIESDLSDDSSFERHQKNHRLRLQRQRIRRHREQQQQLSSSSRNNNNLFEEEEDDDGDDGGNDHDDPGNDDDDDRGYQEDEEPTAITNSEALEQYRDYYKLRRMGDRLSFENLGPLVQPETPVRNRHHHHHPPQPRLSWDPCGFQEQTQPPLTATMTMPLPTPQIPLTTSPQAGKGSKKAHHRPPRRRHPSVLDREDENDFLPKNSNWNHFERYNEDDLECGIVASTPADPKEGSYHHHQLHHYQPFSNGYEFMQEESERSADLVESTRSLAAVAVAEGGDSSSDTSVEPQFVWTDAVHVKKRSQLMSDIIAKHAGGDVPPPIEGDPPPTPNRPQRLMTGDSTLTLPTDNSKHKKSTATPTSVETEQQRQFLRYSSTVSQSEKVPLPPQRFPPPSDIRDHLERAASAETFATANSEVSGTSASSHHKTTKESNYNYPSRNQHPKNNANNNLNVSSSHRSARAQYNAKIMPNKVVLIRHGQSMGNINEDLYSTTPDNAMPLTKLGWEQARKAGKHLKENVLAQKQSIHFIVSPYARTVETFHGIVSAWCDPDGPEFTAIPNRELRLKAWYGKLLEMGLTWHEDPRIREQDFGNYQVPELIRKAKRDRHRFGVFYYRFPHGESASDVFDRVSTFLDSLWRSFDMNRSRNYVLVTHGISVRVLLARYFRYTIHQFNMLANPRNCEMVMLGHDGHGRLALQGRCQLLLKEKAEAEEVDPDKEKTEEEEKTKDADNTNGDNKEVSESKNENAGAVPQNPKKKDKILEVDEYKFFKRLRILPQAAIRKVDIRISYNDGLANDAESG